MEWARLYDFHRFLQTMRALYIPSLREIHANFFFVLAQEGWLSSVWHIHGMAGHHDQEYAPFPSLTRKPGICANILLLKFFAQIRHLVFFHSIDPYCHIIALQFEKAFNKTKQKMCYVWSTYKADNRHFICNLWIKVWSVVATVKQDHIIGAQKTKWGA